MATSAGFTAVRNWLEAAADLMQRSSPHLRLVNATEGGARIENFEELTLAEALHELSDRDLTSAHLRRRRRDRGVHHGATADGVGPRAAAPGQTGGARRPARRAPGHPGHRPCRAGRSARVARAFKRLGRAETAMKKRCSAQLFVEAWGTGGIELASAQAAEMPIENSSHAEALHALRTEAHLSAVIVHAARELADQLLPLTRVSVANGPARV